MAVISDGINTELRNHCVLFQFSLKAQLITFALDAGLDIVMQFIVARSL